MGFCYRISLSLSIQTNNSYELIHGHCVVFGNTIRIVVKYPFGNSVQVLNTTFVFTFVNKKTSKSVICKALFPCGQENA